MEKLEDNSSRFEEFKELEDKSGFVIPSGEVFKLDKFGGWFDEFGKYYNPDAEQCPPPKESLQLKNKLMEEQKIATKLNKQGYEDLDDDELAECYDVVRVTRTTMKNIMKTSKRLEMNWTMMSQMMKT
jgi:hypothetical protein